MKALTLSGRAVAVHGAETSGDLVVRVIDTGSRLPVTSSDVALVSSQSDADSAEASGCRSVVVIGDTPVASERFDLVMRLGSEFGYLADGDILAVETSTKRVRTLYRRSSRHNAFLVTERCNHYCLMCSQPPKDHDDSWLLGRLAKAIPLVAPETRSLGFTGGEPLLNWRPFLSLLGLARDTLPSTALHVLTNGRAFADREITSAWAALGHPNLMAGIPIYASVDHVHDHVVQARGAFDETVLGVLRLKEAGQRIEIRVVLHQLTAPHLISTARWISKNVPFVDHVALMGLENTGFAIANHDRLWIDPVDYADELAAAVDILDAARIPLSIYNLPYCVLAPSAWRYARQSISDWKNDYVEECVSCAARFECAGFFSSGRPKTSRAVTALQAFQMA